MVLKNADGRAFEVHCAVQLSQIQTAGYSFTETEHRDTKFKWVVVAVCASVGRLRWLPAGPHLRRGVYANTSRLALLQGPAAPRVYATLEIAGVCGSGHEWPVPPGGYETAPCFD